MIDYGVTNHGSKVKDLKDAMECGMRMDCGRLGPKLRYEVPLHQLWVQIYFCAFGIEITKVETNATKNEWLVVVG